MQKRFNSTGVCVSRKHYMVDISNKLEQIKKLIDKEFIEHHGRLLFLAFIKPIINGTGFDFKEVKVSEEKRFFKYMCNFKEPNKEAI